MYVYNTYTNSNAIIVYYTPDPNPMNLVNWCS